MDLIFFGMQGSGKGTLGKAVASKYGMQIFETGGELRRLSKEDSELGRKIKSIIDAGDLVDNPTIMEIVENFMNNLQGDSSILFDGIPRQVVQAQTLIALLDKHKRKYLGLELKIQKDTAIKRLNKRRELENRADDTPEAIEKRISIFMSETLPAMELFPEIVQINGEQSVEEVAANAYKVLDPLM